MAESYCIPLFDETNFNHWKRCVESAIEERGLSRFIKNELNSLLWEAKNAKERYRIRRNEKKCVDLIVHSIHDSVQIRDGSTAKNILDELAKKYEHKLEKYENRIGKHINLKRELLALKYEDSSDMNEFLLDFDRKIIALNSFGAKMSDIDIIVHLFICLPQSYEHLISKIDAMDQSLVGIDFVKLMVQHECAKIKHPIYPASNLSSVRTVSNVFSTTSTISEANHHATHEKSYKNTEKEWNDTNNTNNTKYINIYEQTVPKSIPPEKNRTNRTKKQPTSYEMAFPALSALQKTNRRRNKSQSNVSQFTAQEDQTTAKHTCYVCEEKFESNVKLFCGEDLCEECYVLVMKYMMEEYDDCYSSDSSHEPHSGGEDLYLTTNDCKRKNRRFILSK